MSEENPEKEPTSSTPAEQPTWRDDPLSVFLVVAAVLLGLMYFLEQRDVSMLEDASVRAKELGATVLDLEQCTVGSASTGGRTLVVSCSGTAASAATAAAQRRPDLSGFDAVVFTGDDEQLVCNDDPLTWPNGCHKRPTPAIE